MALLSLALVWLIAHFVCDRLTCTFVEGWLVDAFGLAEIVSKWEKSYFLLGILNLFLRSK